MKGASVVKRWSSTATEHGHDIMRKLSVQPPCRLAAASRLATKTAKATARTGYQIFLGTRPGLVLGGGAREEVDPQLSRSPLLGVHLPSTTSAGSTSPATAAAGASAHLRCADFRRSPGYCRVLVASGNGQQLEMLQCESRAMPLLVGRGDEIGEDHIAPDFPLVNCETMTRGVLPWSLASSLLPRARPEPMRRNWLARQRDDGIGGAAAEFQLYE